MASGFGNSTLNEVEEYELPDSLEPDDLTPIESVTANIRGLFRGFTKFDDRYLVGEVSDLDTSTGNLYFSIKAAHGRETIRCVVWDRDRDDLGVTLKSGMLVAVKGTLSFYEDGGYPSLEVQTAHLVGESAYWQRIEQLEAELREEGLLDEESKSDPPTFPSVVGVVTAAGSDAEQDLVESIHQRYPDVDVRIHNTTVQGKGAPEGLGRAIDALDTASTDVIVVARGGGSDTALRTFNEEPVVRAVADAETPTVTAIGHDADEPLVDKVADVRVKTPTAAGEAVVVEKERYREWIDEVSDAINQTYSSRLDRWLEDRQQAIETDSTDLCRRWIETQRKTIKAEATDLVETWLRDVEYDVTGEYDAIAIDWLHTNRAVVERTASSTVDNWLRTQRRSVRGSYTDVVADWIDEQRSAIDGEIDRIEREHTFEEEKAGLERRNTVLIAMVVVLVLVLLVVVAAFSLGVV